MIIQVYMESSRTDDAKRAGAKALTQAACDTLGVKPEWVHIIYENYDRNDWAIHGKLLTELAAARKAAEDAAAKKE
jgi:4-oxalocrotonate tautomerase